MDTLPHLSQSAALTHRCHAPWQFQVTPGTAVEITVAANAYLAHHRSCRECAPSGAYCTFSEWYNPDRERLCPTGRALLRAWERATYPTKQTKRQNASSQENEGEEGC
jgi:hypothetical protein